MKKSYAGTLGLLLFLAILISGCIMKEKVLDIVLTQKSCADFSEWHIVAAFTTPVTLDLGKEVEDILASNNVSRSDIKFALLVSVSYGVTQFSHVHDWFISGAITVARGDVSDGPAEILAYKNQSIAGALDTMITADLNKAGVDLVNRALSDFIQGGNPVLIVSAENGSVSPLPSSVDPIEFQWKACMVMHIVVRQSFDVPDPF